jgi:hypothetical protein
VIAVVIQCHWPPFSSESGRQKPRAGWLLYSDLASAIMHDAERMFDPITVADGDLATGAIDDGIAAERAETIEWVRRQFAEALPVGGTPGERYLS